MGVSIRFAASDADREAIYRLRYDVYVREMHMFADVADHAGGRLLDDHDQTARLILAEADGEAVGTMRLNWGGDAPISAEHRLTYGLDRFLTKIDPKQVNVITRLVVRPEYRRTDLTMGLIRLGATQVRALESTLQFCDCQPHLISMYEGLGFRPYATAYNDPHFGIMVPLVLVCADGERLASIHSPLEPIFRDWPPNAELPSLLSLIPESPPVRVAMPSKERLDLDVTQLLESRGPDRVSLFDDLDEDQVRRLLRRGHVIECSRGAFVLRRGQILRTLFVLLQGELEARIDGVPINTVGSGEMFGEVAFLLGIPRTVDLLASSPHARLLSLNEAAVRKLIREDAELAAVIHLNVARALAVKLARRDTATAE